MPCTGSCTKQYRMRFKRAKQVKRNMAIYCHSFGFREPYQVILDGTFLQVARSNGKSLEEVLPQFLGAPVRLMTTYCVYAELKKLGPDFRPTAAQAKKLEKRRCPHTQAVTAAECLKEIIGEANSNNYCIATQDIELKEELRKIAGIPLIYINKSVLLLESASTATSDKVAQMEIKKSLPQSFEKRLTKEPDEEAIALQVKILKKKKKLPNSLSMKKKAEKRPIVAGGLTRKRKRKSVDTIA